MAVEMMNIFTGDAFSNVTLTTLVNQNFPYVPGYLTNLNLAPATGMTTTMASFEDVSANVRMISATPRGAPPSQIEHQKGRIRMLEAVHLAREVTVNADELLAARARGTMNPQSLQNLLMERTDGPAGVKVQLGLTMEHMLLGMIDGQVYDADGTTLLWDFYDWTVTSRPTAINIAFSSGMSATDSALLVSTTLALKRQAIAALNGLATGSARAIVLCGDNFFDALMTSPEVVRARKLGAFGAADAASTVSLSTPYASMDYAGILWVNYRGTADGLVGVPTNEGRFFMAGVPGLFQTLYAPADTFDTVTGVGLPYYLLNDPNEAGTDKRAVFELQSNPLLVCLRPTSLFHITKS